ncbi:DNA-binding protein [Proteiniphilum sp.]|uniref:type II toxin-antitoxin system HicB family antitoxin n=1 Tax=Proteiniphilum sp. TaxID=1926877 RepID=UPI0033203CB8
MKKIIIIIESSSDYFDAYAENCPGIYGAGETVEAAQKNVLEGLTLYIEQNKNHLPEILKGDYGIEFRYNVQSFLKRYAKQFSLSGLETITGINQKQLSHYVTGRKRPRKNTVKKIEKSIHNFAKDLSQVHFV